MIIYVMDLKDLNTIWMTHSGLTVKSYIILSIQDQRDELYGNHMPMVLECCLVIIRSVWISGTIIRWSL